MQILNGQTFDASSVNPAETFQPLPPGDYKVVITASEAKATSKGDGGLLELDLKVLEGQYMGRELKYRLNLYNASPQAVEIAYRQLSALCHVVGVIQIVDSQQLHGTPFIAVVGISKNDPNYNDVKGVKDINGNVPGKGRSTAVASAPAPAPAAPAQAWQQPAAAPAYGPPAAAPPAWSPAAPAAAPAAPAWTPNPPAQTAPAAPAWAPPGAPQAPAAPAAAPPPWNPGGAPPAAPTWGK